MASADVEQQNGGSVENGSETNGPSVSDDHRKLFAGGLSWETNAEQLKEYFGKYGEIESVNLKTDPNTGKSRGFAFILFKSTEGVDAVLAAGEHNLNNRKIDTKKAKAKQGKLFVGGLTADLTDDDIKNHFAQFGTIVQVELPFDKVKNQRKAFCFITYESESIVNSILKNSQTQTIKDKQVDVKKATPKPDQGRGGGFGGSYGGRGGRGGGRGGYNQNWNQGYNNGGYGGYDQAWGGYDAYGYGGGYGAGYDNYGGGYQQGGGNQRGRGRGRNKRLAPY